MNLNDSPVSRVPQGHQGFESPLAGPAEAPLVTLPCSYTGLQSMETSGL